MNVDTQWVKDNAGVGEALRDVNLLDSEQDCAFMMGAQWHAADAEQWYRRVGALEPGEGKVEL